MERDRHHLWNLESDADEPSLLERAMLWMA
jgi:hypothetical protein